MNGYIQLAAQLVGLLIGLVLHEVAHGYVAFRLGDNTARDRGRLTLNPLVHIDPFATLAMPILLILLHSPVVFAAARPVPFNPWAVRGGRKGAALVAVAGPLTNLLIALFFGLWIRLLPISTMVAGFLAPIVLVNLALCVFNLIPFPPLDGSRVLYAFAPEGMRDVMDRIEQSGFIVLLAIMLIGYQYIAPFISLIVYTLANAILPGTY